MTKATTKPRRFMGAEEFIRAWETAPTFAAFLRRYPGTPGAAKVRASRMRHRDGLPLRRFGGGETKAERKARLSKLLKGLRGGK